MSIYFAEHKIDEETNKERKDLDKAQDRQAIALPVLGAPFLAATLPLAAAGALGVYGTYGDEILMLLNSVLGNNYNNISKY